MTDPLHALIPEGQRLGLQIQIQNQPEKTPIQPLIYMYMFICDVSFSIGKLHQASGHVVKFAYGCVEELVSQF